MGRRRYQPHIKKNSTFGLNITSMTDMFTMLLVFLLQTYSTSEVQIEPQDNLRLPQSTTQQNPVDSVKISLSTHELKLDRKVLAQINNNLFISSDLEEHDPSLIKPLFSELDQLAKDPKAKGFVKEGKILFQADSGLPYSTLRKVMYTASMAGFPQLKFVTVVGD